MNRLMRATLLAFVVSLAVWGLIAVWHRSACTNCCGRGR